MHPNGRWPPRSSPPLRISRHTAPLSLSSLSLSLANNHNPTLTRRISTTYTRRPKPPILWGFFGSHSSKKNQGKVPKRIHKSEREKLKREHLNELFLALTNSLGPSQQNNGKASILGETTRFLKEMHTQIECLKRENATLLSESQYLTIEKNELQDENAALEAQIGKLRIEIDERVVHSKPDLNVPPQEEPTSHFPIEPVLRQAPYVNPVYVIPVCSDLPAYPEHDATQLARRPIANVSKPHARYPNAFDSWPTQLLGKQPEISKQL